MIITSLDVCIPFSQRHPNETIRIIIRYDSGYLKDLFLKNKEICFTEDCLSELCRLTRGFHDNWEKPINPTSSIFYQVKSYRTPYQFDFNNNIIIEENSRRLKSHNYGI